jgi:hypothetical protein
MLSSSNVITLLIWVELFARLMENDGVVEYIWRCCALKSLYDIAKPGMMMMVMMMIVTTTKPTKRKI